MTLDAILTCFCLATKGSSLLSMVKQTKSKGQKISYNSLIDFFNEPWQTEIELKSAAENLFELKNGWLALDEIVLAKSKESLIITSVKRRYKSAGGYITPSISLVLLLWCDGKQRVPLALAYRDLESVQAVALKLLSEARNKFKLKPMCILMDSGFFSYELLERIDSYGWMFVCRVPKYISFEGKRIWQFKRQGFWNDPGHLKCGLKVRAVRRADKFYLCNRVSKTADEILKWYQKRAVIEEVFKILKQCCHWSYCQLRSEDALKRYYTFGLLTFMAWEHKRIQAIETCTIYKMRSDVMFDNLNPPIPDYFLQRRIA